MLQLNFCVFMCAFHPEISSFFGKSFLFLFIFFCVIQTSVLSYPRENLDYENYSQLFNFIHSFHRLNLRNYVWVSNKIKLAQYFCSIFHNQYPISSGQYEVLSAHLQNTVDHADIAQTLTITTC